MAVPEERKAVSLVESGICWVEEHLKTCLIVALFLLSLHWNLNAYAASSDSLNSFYGEDTLTMDSGAFNMVPSKAKELYKSTPNRILLTGFYDNSVYPSNSIYKHWDSNTLFPEPCTPIEEDDSVNLILQDRDNFCHYYTPIQGVITSAYGPRHGRMHEGIDIDLRTGDGVRASFDGMVRVAKQHPSYGNVVVVRHYNGLETLYAHLSKIKVESGDIVNAGDVIAYGGNTGRSTGSHLHFELRYRGEALNPKDLISFNKNCLVSDSILLVREHGKYRVIPLGIKFHTVQKGDYLYRIARRYGLSVSKICEINGIRRNEILRIGQKIRLQEVNYAQTFKH